jgi:hypothetical protein
VRKLRAVSLAQQARTQQYLRSTLLWAQPASQAADDTPVTPATSHSAYLS